MAGSVADLFRYFTDSASLLATASAFHGRPPPFPGLLPISRLRAPRLQKRDYRRFTVQAPASRRKRVATLEERVYFSPERAEAAIAPNKFLCTVIFVII